MESRDLGWLALLFVTVLWTLFRTVGTSPHVWVDTAIEDKFVRECVTGNRCTLVGPGATVGIFHSAGYLSWRAMLAWLGLTLDGVHVLLVVMNAVGVVLAAACGLRLSGRLAGAMAAVIVMQFMGVQTQMDVVSDVVPMPFLGIVFLLLAIADVQSPRIVSTAVLGMVAGVTANVYSTGLELGLCAVLLATLLPRPRLHATVAAAAFIATTLAIAPGTWLVDARILLTQHVGNGGSIIQRTLSEIPIARFTAYAALTWMAAAFARPALRRSLDVPFVLIAPMFVVLAASTMTGRLNPSDKYCSHIIGAVAVMVAVVCANAFVPGRFISGNASNWWTRFGPRLASPIIVVTVLAQGIGNDDQLTYRDLTAVKHDLGDELKWPLSRMARNLKTPDDEVTPEFVYNTLPDWPVDGIDDDGERAYLVKVPKETPVLPVPDTVRVMNSADGHDTLLFTTCSWIDWRNFRACFTETGGVEKCADASLPTPQAVNPQGALTVPGMPMADAHKPLRGKMTLHLPLKPSAFCPEEWIYLPNNSHVCPGHLVGASAGSPTRLRAGDGEAVIEWELGTEHCANRYRGYPPFFVEGDRKTVQALATIFDDEAARESHE